MTDYILNLLKYSDKEDKKFNNDYIIIYDKDYYADEETGETWVKDYYKIVILLKPENEIPDYDKLVYDAYSVYTKEEFHKILRKEKFNRLMKRSLEARL